MYENVGLDADIQSDIDSCNNLDDSSNVNNECSNVTGSENAEKLNIDFSAYLRKNFDISSDSSKVNTTIPTGIDVLDALLGGGVATGIVQLVGPPGCGKSALLARIIASGQRKYPGKFLSVYLDSEESMTVDRLSSLGVLYPQIEPITSITVERVFKVMDAVFSYKDNNPDIMDIPSIIGWDSVANTQTEFGEKSESVNSIIGERARILSMRLPVYAKKLNQYKVSLVAVNQLREKIDIGVFNSPNDLRYMGDKNIPGGQALLYNSKQILTMRPTTIIKGEYGFIGTMVKCKSVKNKLFQPNIEFNLCFSNERGFSNFFSNYNLLKDCKKLSSGAWCYLQKYPEKKFRQSEVINIYKTDPKFKEIFDSEVSDALQLEYIQKYSATSLDSVDLL